jgi:hypothetical protein
MINLDFNATTPNVISIGTARSVNVIVPWKILNRAESESYHRFHVSSSSLAIFPLAYFRAQMAREAN